MIFFLKSECVKTYFSSKKTFYYSNLFLINLYICIIIF